MHEIYRLRLTSIRTNNGVINIYDCLWVILVLDSHSMNGSNNQNILVYGREVELSKLLEGLQKIKSVTLLSGESGIGKSMLLDNFYLKTKSLSNTIVAYYDQNIALISELHDYSYPVKILLKTLVQNIKESEGLELEKSGKLSRVKKDVLTYLSVEKKQIAESIFDQIFASLKLEQTAPILKNIIRIFTNKKLSVEAAAKFAKQRESLLEIFIRIFICIRNEFPDKKFVLIIDRLERTGKASVDFLMNLINFLPDNFHFFLSYEAGTWESESEKKIYDDTRNKLMHDLHGNEIMLEGLYEDAIGKWIHDARGVDLPLVPDLKMIRKNSGGIPIVLEQWIRTSKDLDFNQIERREFCDRIVQSGENLSDYAFNNLEKLSILQTPLSENKMTLYLRLDSVDKVVILERELIRNGIFDSKTRWFKHELIKKCFEDSISNETKKRYHDTAAKLYAYQIKEFSNGDEKNTSEYLFQSYLAQAYHIHRADDFQESFNKNLFIGEVATRLGEFDVAEHSFTMAIEAAIKINNIEGKMLAQNNLAASVYMVWARWDKALPIFEDLEQYYKNTNDKKKLAVVIMNIGDIYRNKGNLEQGMNYYLKGLEIANITGNRPLLSNIHNRIGMIHSQRGDYNKALKGFNEALKNCPESGTDKASILNNVAVIEADKGNYKEAMEGYKESLEITRNEGNQFGIALLLRNIGEIYWKMGDLNQALITYHRSLEIDERMGNVQGIASNLSNIGLMYDELGKVDEALSNYSQAYDMAKKMEDKPLMSQILNNLGIIHNRQGKLEEAIKNYTDSLEIKDQLNDNAGILRTLVNLGNIDSKKGDYRQAMSKYERALKIAETIGNKELLDLINLKIELLRTGRTNSG